MANFSLSSSLSRVLLPSSPAAAAVAAAAQPKFGANFSSFAPLTARRCEGRPLVAHMAAAAAPAAAQSPTSPLPVSGTTVEQLLSDVPIVSAATGEPVFLKDLWDQEEGTAVVALLRHFGCVCCWELARDLRDAKARFDAAGVKLIAVGIGSADKAHILAERLPFPLECLYADPDRKAYDILGLYYGLGRTFFNPASAKVFRRFDSIKEAVKNYTIRATPDDKSSVLQQGGMFVFKGKELLYARKDEGTGDHAPLDEVLDLCCKVAVV